MWRLSRIYVHGISFFSCSTQKQLDYFWILYSLCSKRTNLKMTYLEICSSSHLLHNKFPVDEQEFTGTGVLHKKSWHSKISYQHQKLLKELKESSSSLNYHIIRLLSSKHVYGHLKKKKKKNYTASVSVQCLSILGVGSFYCCLSRGLFFSPQLKGFFLGRDSGF